MENSDKMPSVEWQSLFSGTQAFSRLVEVIMVAFRENAKHAFMGNAESMDRFYAACDYALRELHGMERTDGLCQLSAQEVIQERKQILQMMNDKDSENKTFLSQVAIGVAILTGSLAAAWAYLGFDKKR